MMLQVMRTLLTCKKTILIESSDGNQSSGIKE